ncbi:MAG: hypothetical protein ACO1RX_18985 [Candidatus Sericytochromatia bacterium]
MSLKPSLLFVLHNFRVVPAEQLWWALHYQFGRPWDASLGYSQILIAFNHLSPKKLVAVREIWGELDEEPIGHLLLDTGLISFNQLLKVQALRPAYPRTYTGQLLVRQDYISSEQIQSLLENNYFSPPTSRIEKLAARRHGLELLQQRLLMRELLTPALLERLGFRGASYLPVGCKPLADLLVMLGDFPDHLLPCMLEEPVALANEPLLALLIGSGYPPDTLLPKLASLHSPQDQGKNLAVLLVEKGLISVQRLSHLILETYRCGSITAPPASAHS